jgi:hypothetical protein
MERSFQDVALAARLYCSQLKKANSAKVSFIHNANIANVLTMYRYTQAAGALRRHSSKRAKVDVPQGIDLEAEVEKHAQEKLLEKEKSKAKAKAKAKGKTEAKAKEKRSKQVSDEDIDDSDNESDLEEDLSDDV